MAQGAWKDWSEGELVTEALFQDIQDSIAFIYASESAANTALTRKVEGTQFYDTGADKLKIWDGSAWQEVGTTAILQVVTGTTTTDSGAIASTSFSDSGLSAAITPSATSSKVLVMVSQTLNAERDSGEIFGYVNIMRATTEVGEWFFQGNSNRIGHVSIMYVDSPSTTSATTYKTQIRASTTSDGGKVRANQQSTSGESPSSIHLIEIAG
jgi:hypothetical protein